MCRKKLKTGKEQLEQAARAGLDFFVATQCVDNRSADCGRFPWYYDSVRCKTTEMSHNWITAVGVEARRRRR